MEMDRAHPHANMSDCRTGNREFIVLPGMYFQKVKFHVSGYNLRHTPHILILFFAHSYTHVSVHICTQVTMATTTII